MKPFLDEDFLLQNESAIRLYHDYARDMPIFDYHCHLPPGHIAKDHQFADLAEAWLAGDHYKWRAMRTNGVEEQFVTGDASPKDKFLKWAETVPATIGNPLFHWTHLELRRYFHVEDLLNPKHAPRIWEEANRLLAQPEYRVRGLLKRMKVRYVGTTDDPIDSLEHHAAMSEDSSMSKDSAMSEDSSLSKDSAMSVVVRPSFRPDKTYALRDPKGFRGYLEKLSAAAGLDSIQTFEDLREALRRRIDYFHERGCRVSDHALTLPVNRNYTEGLLNGIIASAYAGNLPEAEDEEAFTTAVLEFLGKEYARRGWVMQLHIGAQRNNNTRMFKALGPDTGFDSMADGPVARPLAGLLDRLDRTNELPKTVLYGLNPRDNDLLATMIGNFQDGSVPGKIQFGSGWWFNDQKDGMERQMIALGNMGLLSRFVGMLTDSRSFLSFPRHEYFRRVLSNLIGTWVENGELPADYELLGTIIQDICWYNAVDYFQVPGVNREVD